MQVLKILPDSFMIGQINRANFTPPPLTLAGGWLIG